MTWQLIKKFNNSGQGANAAGVCEAAVCLWLKHTQQLAGQHYDNYLPSTREADILYQAFDDSEYLYRFASYLESQIFPFVASNTKPGDKKEAEIFDLDCCHFSGYMHKENSAAWLSLISRLDNGDALFLNLVNPSMGHAVGVYKGSQNIWIFDPNSGLYNGVITSSEQRSDTDAQAAAGYLGKLTQSWQKTSYYGFHMKK